MAVAIEARQRVILIIRESHQVFGLLFLSVWRIAERRSSNNEHQGHDSQRAKAQRYKCLS